MAPVAVLVLRCGRQENVAAPLPQGGGELPLLHCQEDHAPLPPQQHLPPGHPLRGGHHPGRGERHPALPGGNKEGPSSLPFCTLERVSEAYRQQLLR